MLFLFAAMMLLVQPDLSFMHSATHDVYAMRGPTDEEAQDVPDEVEPEPECSCDD